MATTGDEMCLWRNEMPDQLVWRVIASKSLTAEVAYCDHFGPLTKLITLTRYFLRSDFY